MSQRHFYWLIFLVVLVCSCKNDTQKPQDNYVSLSGLTMGTTYSVSFKASPSLAAKYQKDIDSILVDINQSLSTYIPSSTISQINNDSVGIKTEILLNGSYSNFIKYALPIDVHFIVNFEQSDEVFKKSSGFFDPTIMSLVNYWGFGYTDKKAITKIDSQKVSSILKDIGFLKWSMSKSIDSFQLLKPIGAQLDFSGIAKGYGVDVIAQYIQDQGIQDFLVEIGGEIFAKGKNRKNKAWSVALNKPKIDAPINQAIAAVNIDGIGLASSGNYRNYYKVDGQYYGHEINPKTGYPEINDLLGVSVIAPNCMLADAYATAFMVIGYQESKSLIERFNDMEACFFTSGQEGEITQSTSSGFDRYFLAE